MIRFALPVLLMTSVAATAARAGGATLSTSGARSLALWTDGLSSSEDFSDRLVGVALEREGPMTIEGRFGLQQHADPATRDSGKALWAVSGAPALAPHLRLDLRSEGAIDSLGRAYTQNLTGALVWTARRTFDFTSSLQLKTDLFLDVTGATATFGLGPEWTLTMRGGQDPSHLRTELRAGLAYRTPSDGPPSASAMVELRFFHGE